MDQTSVKAPSVAQEIPEERRRGSRRLAFLITLFLITATIWAYQDLPRHDFVNFDDIDYVTENPQVRSGLTVNGFFWAFTATHAGNWHPLTWLSHMLDCQLFGMKPGMHHVVNLLFHLANSVLLFLLLRRMTGALWRGAFVAGLFALHPLHVESVAWVSERKDVLSTFFLILTLHAYVHYAKKPEWRRYASVTLWLILGLLSKPMLVTLPFLLLLMDYWPLARFHMEPGDRWLSRVNLRPVGEKIPWFVLVVALSGLTYSAQNKGGLVLGLHVLPLGLRISNALLSYVGYIAKTIWPLGLAVYYPHPDTIPFWKAAAAALGLAAVTVLLVRAAGKRPHLAVGWLWYLGTLVPVIGLVHVGGQAMADRYTYVPSLGLFILLAWSLPDPTGFGKGRAATLPVLAVLALSFCATLTRAQSEYWRDSLSLWAHTLKVTDRNYTAHNMLGGGLAREGRPKEAAVQFQEALRINPDYDKAHYYMGLSLMEEKRFEEAMGHLGRALELRCDFPQVVLDKQGEILLLQGREGEGLERFNTALQADPRYVPAHLHAGECLERTGRMEEAIAHYRKAVAIDPASAVSHFHIGRILLAQGKVREASGHYEEALRVQPGLPEAHYNMGVLAEQQGRARDAQGFYRSALRLKPDYDEARNNLGALLAREGRCREAVIHFSAVLRVRPNHDAAKSNLDLCRERLEAENR